MTKSRTKPKPAFIETEIKLPVEDDDLKKIRRRLKRLGFRLSRRRVHEDNYLFDFADRRLRRRGRLLRLRFVGGKSLLTFKGPAGKGPAGGKGPYKTRTELEFAVRDGKAFRQVIEIIGLNVSFRYEKYRTTFSEEGSGKRHRGAVAVLDETPIGNFLELEGPPGWIDRVAQGLGYRKKDYISASYATLYRLDCRRKRRKAGHMVFR
ncbi:MAG: CYTH domain-containing protein [Acidobacteria bacterium]|nr:CYTH domain-containing protein [Acidobacteriota bacterium]